MVQCVWASAELSRTVVFDIIVVEKRGRAVIQPFEIKSVGCPSMKTSRMVVCGKFTEMRQVICSLC